MAFRLSCPSCNASFVRSDVPAGARADCPRCGDAFPVKSWEEVADSAQSAEPILAGAPSRRDRARWSVQRTTVVAVAMGIVGLIAGLAVYYSRDKPRGKPVNPGSASSATVAPAGLTGLGYLPADASIVFAVQPGPILVYAERTRQDPRALVTRAGIPGQAFDAIANFGVPLAQFDHIAGAANVDELRFTVVVVLREPLENEEALLKRLKSQRDTGPRDRHKVQLGGVPMFLARVSSTIWVFGWDVKDLAGADRGGYGTGGKQFFSPSLVRMIEERVPAGAAAWVATGEERWSEKPLLPGLLMIQGKRDWLPVLARGRAAMAAVSLEDPPRLRLFLTAADDQTGKQLQTYFARRAESDELASHGGAGAHAYYDAPVAPESLASTLERMIADAVRK